MNATVAYDGEVLSATHGFALAPHGAKTYVSIFVDETKRMIEKEDIIILDVRAKEEYEHAHIAGAICVPSAERWKLRRDREQEQEDNRVWRE